MAKNEFRFSKRELNFINKKTAEGIGFDGYPQNLKRRFEKLSSVYDMIDGKITKEIIKSYIDSQ